MPRGPRLDAPGVTHHVMIRGVDGCDIFRDDHDREDLASRLDRWVPSLGAYCLASTFMSNHAHFILESGIGGLSQLMARVLTGYAMRFNLRHDRDGHLFQNRFLSELIHDDAYRKTSIAYVFRNQIEIGLTLDEVIASRWCSLGAVLGVREARAFESVGKTLAVFGGDARTLVAAIERAEPARDPSQWREFDVKPRLERVVTGALEFEVLVKEVCAARSVDPAALLTGSRLPAVVAARRRVVIRAVLVFGMRVSDVARRLRISRQAVGQIVEAELSRGG